MLILLWGAMHALSFVLARTLPARHQISVYVCTCGCVRSGKVPRPWRWQPFTSLVRPLKTTVRTPVSLICAFTSIRFNYILDCSCSDSWKIRLSSRLILCYGFDVGCCDHNTMRRFGCLAKTAWWGAVGVFCDSHIPRIDTMNDINRLL